MEHPLSFRPGQPSDEPNNHTPSFLIATTDVLASPPTLQPSLASSASHSESEMLHVQRCDTDPESALQGSLDARPSSSGSRVLSSKRSYQSLPQLSIPLNLRAQFISSVVQHNEHIDSQDVDAGADDQSTASSSEPPSSISTTSSHPPASTPATPTSSLNSPIVGVVDLTKNVKTTSSSPVSHGGYSDIHRGELEITTTDGEQKKIEKTEVAIKLLRVLSSKGYDEDKARKRLNREVYVWHRLDHPNIATFLGTSYHMSGRPSLILPWFENGSASEYLKLRNPSADRLKLILDVAEGLKYLHTYKPAPIVHGDLKGNNILITDDGHATLTDFGLSQVIEDLVGPTGITPSNTEAGPIRWQSPEFISDISETCRPQLPGDVWSFGCTAYELLTGNVPYYFRLRDPAIICDIQAGVKPPGVENDRLRSEGGIWKLLNDCWITDPTQRIQMTQVVPRLKELCSSSTISENY